MLVLLILDMEGWYKPTSLRGQSLRMTKSQAHETFSARTFRRLCMMPVQIWQVHSKGDLELQRFSIFAVWQIWQGWQKLFVLCPTVWGGKSLWGKAFVKLGSLSQLPQDSN